VLASILVLFKEMWLTTSTNELRAPVLLDAGTVEVGSSLSHPSVMVGRLRAAVFFE
jgi:hypothetical protein